MQGTKITNGECRMKEIANILKIRLGDRFTLVPHIDGDNYAEGFYYRLEETGLYIGENPKRITRKPYEYQNAPDLEAILNGEYDIYLLPWIPQKYNEYWVADSFLPPKVLKRVCYNSRIDLLNIRMGLVHRTAEEAILCYEQDMQKLTDDKDFKLSPKDKITKAEYKYKEDIILSITPT